MKSRIYDALDAFAADKGFVSAMKKAEEWRECLADMLEVTGVNTESELSERLLVVQLSATVNKWIVHNTAPYLCSLED